MRAQNSVGAARIRVVATNEDPAVIRRILTPPRAPEASAAPAGSVRAVQLDLRPPTGDRGDARDVFARRCLASDHRPVGFPTAAPLPRQGLCGPPFVFLSARALKVYIVGDSG